MRLFPPALALAAATLAACNHNARPLNVPGPTTAHPPGYSPSGEPAPAAPSVRSVLQRSPGTNVVAFRIVFAAGSADDPPGKEGLTSLTADTMAVGGTASMTYPELVAKLYPMATGIDTITDRDETVFSAEVASADLASFAPLLEEVLLAPRLDEAGFERTRSQAKSSLVDDLRGANDEALGKEALQAFLYEGHPYGHPAVGTERGLASSTVADVRAHRARVFCRERAIIGIAGDFPEAFAEAFTHDLAALPSCAGERAALPAPRKLAGLHVLVVDKPTADSTAISMGYPYDLSRSSPDFPAVAFFADYLGIHRQSSGRLYQELREKRGLNYGDYAYAEHFRQAGGSRVPLPNIARREQYFSIWLRPVPAADAIFALRGALYETTTLLAHPIDASEITRYRTFLDRYTSLEELTPSRRLGYAIDDLTYGLARPYLTTMHDAWDSLDPASLAAAVGRHVQVSDVAVVLVAKDGAALAEALVSGAPSHAPLYKSPKPASVVAADAEIVKLPLRVAKENVRVVPASELFRE